MKRSKLFILPALIVAASLAGCGDASSAVSSVESVVSSVAPVSSSTSSSYVPEEPSSFVIPEIKEASIEDLLAKTAADNTVVYVKGLVSDVANGGDCGDVYLSDPVSKKQIYVYGLSLNDSSLALTDTGTGSYTGVFTNDKTFKSIGLVDGDYIKMFCVVDYYNNAPQLKGYMGTAKPVVAAGKGTWSYNLTVNDATNGTVKVGQTVNSVFTEATTAKAGDVIEVKATPATGYDIDTVKVKLGDKLTSTISADKDGVYSFAASVVNEVTVTFKEHVTAKVTVPNTNLIGDKAVGDSVSGTAMQVVYQGGSGEMVMFF